MYLYFDRNGTLKEYVNDDALRQGNDGINKMYIYVDRNDLHGVDARFTLADGTIIQAPNEYTTFVNKEIPFDAKRDLRYFRYYTGYKFLVIDLASEDFGDVNPLSYGGLVHASLNFILLGSLPPLLQLGDINFNVEVSADGGNVLPQEYLNLSDYQYLRRIIADVEVNKADIINIADFDGFTTVEDLWNRLYGPADGEDIKVNFVDFKGFNIDDRPLYTTFVRVSKNNDYYGVDIVEPDGLYHQDNVYKDTKLQEFATFTAFADKITNPMISSGDLIYGGTNGTPQRLPKGRSKQVLAMDQWGNAPEWQDFAGSVIEVDFSGDTTVGELLAVMPAKVNNFTTAQINFGTMVINNVAYDLGICNVIVYGSDNNIVIGGAKFTLYNIIPLSVNDTLSALTKINNTTVMTNPMQDVNDMIIGGFNGEPLRLEPGTANQVLKMSFDGTYIHWGNVSNESIIVDGTALLSSSTINDLLALMTLSDSVYSAFVEFGALSIKNGTYPLGLCNVVIKYLVGSDAYQVAIQGPRYTLYSDGIEGTDTLSNLEMVNNPEIIDARSLNDTHLTISVGNIIGLITQQSTAQWTNGMLTALIDFGTLTINGVNYDFGISNVIIKDADDTQYLVYINSNNYYLYSETRKSISATLEDLTLLNNRIIDGTDLSSTDYLEDLEALLQPKKDNLRIGLVNLGEMDFDGVHYSLGLCNVMFNYRSHTGTTADVVIQGAKYLLYGNSLDTTAKAFTDLKVRLLTNIAERVDDTTATESTTINHIIDELPEWDDNCKCGFINFGTIVINSTTYNIGLCNVMITAGYIVDIVGTKWRLSGTGLNGTDTIADLTISSTTSTGGGGASYIDGTALSGTVTPTQLIALLDTDVDGVAFGMVDFGVFTLAGVDYDFGLCNVMVKSTSSTEANVIISNGKYVVYGNGIEKNVSINYQVQLIDVADRVLVDFYDNSSSAFNSALSSADYGKLANAQIIYDYTLSSNRNPIYLYKAENKSAIGSGYTFLGSYINREITVNFGPAPGYTITVRQTNPMTAQGDIVVGGNNGYATRLGKGSQGQILTMGANSPQWADKYIDGTALTENSTFQNVFDLLGSETGHRTGIVKFGSLFINGHTYDLGIGVVYAWTIANPNYKLEIITSRYKLYGSSTSTSTTLNELTIIDLSDALINPITSPGDLIVGDSNGKPVRLAKGSTGKVLKAGSNGLTWANENTGMTNPMNSVGDIIVGGTSGAPRRLPIGSVGKVLTSDGSNVYWGTASGGSATEIVVVSELPTADAGSPSFIQYNGHLYRKKTIVPNVATITDLSGTTWYFDEMIDLFSEGTYDFNFNSGGYTCIGMRAGSGTYTHLNYITSVVSYFIAYTPSTGLWEDEAYRTIEISGGTDATDSDLIAWVKNNATLIGATTNTYVYELVGDIALENNLPIATAETPIFIQYNGSFYRKKTNVSYASASDLTSLRNTNWLIDLEPAYLVLVGSTFNLVFTSNNTDYKYFDFLNNKLEYQAGGGQNTIVCQWSTNGVISYNPVWVDNAYRTVNITGGTSTDDADLLSWFKANATWLNPTPTYTYEYVKVCDELDATSLTTSTTIAELIALLPAMNNGLTSAMVDFGVFNSTAMGLCQVVIYETATDTYSVAIKGALNTLTGTGLAPTDTLGDLT